MRSETAVRRRPREAAAVEGDRVECCRRSTPGMVGLAGLEPAASSLSGIEGSALCGAAFPQVAGECQGRRDAFKQPARSAHRRDAVAAGKVCHQPVADKVMGLPGGRGSPIGWRNRGQAACSSRALRLVRLAASTASPPTSARAATSTAREVMSQPACLLGSVGAGAGTWAGVVVGL
jgi:hypothetical protein